MKPLLIMLVSLGFLGCTTDSGLLVEINGERGLEDLERYRVTVVASQNNPCPNEDGSCLDPFVAYTCRPVTRNFKDEAKDFPIPILIRPGRQFRWQCVVIRVQGFRGGAEQIRAEEIFCPERLYDDVTLEQMQLYSLCNVNHCTGEEVCEWNFDERHAECVPQRLNPVFELPPAVDEPCGAGDIETPDADLTDADSTDDGGAK